MNRPVPMSKDQLLAVLDDIRAHIAADAIADEMTEQGAVEGSASKAVHPTTPLGLGAPVKSWTTALAVARSQPGIESELSRPTTGDPS